MYEIKGVYGARSGGVCGLARKGEREKGRKGEKDGNANLKEMAAIWPWWK